MKNKIKKIFVKIYTHFIPCKTQRYLIRENILNNKNTEDCYVYGLVKKTYETLISKNDIFKPDITKCPKATGILRLIQQANLIFLKKITKICEENNLTYFINYGTLLGAIRHKGFIPWDDDIDICILRPDYEKLVQILKKIPEIQYTLTDCLRIKYSDLPIHLDILPIDFYFKAIETESDKQAFFKSKEKADKEVEKHKKIDFNNPADTWPYNDYINIRNKFIFGKQKPKYKEGISLFRGIETWGNPRSYYKYDWVFPLKKYKFEDCEFFGPNRSDILLFENYGDYMSWPDYIRLHDQKQEPLNIETFIKLTEIVKNEKL